MEAKNAFTQDTSTDQSAGKKETSPRRAGALEEGRKKLWALSCTS